MGGCCASANEVIQSADRPAEASWQAPVPVSDEDEEAKSPEVAVDEQGDAVAVWAYSLSRFGTEEIQAAGKPAGGSWQPVGCFYSISCCDRLVLMDQPSEQIASSYRHHGGAWVAPG